MKSAFFRNATVYTLAPEVCRKLNSTKLAAELEQRRFKEGVAGATGTGWISPTAFDDALFYEGSDNFMLLTMRVECKVLPAALVKREAKTRLDELERQQGHKPSRKQRKEVTEDVHADLLAKAPSVFKDTRLLFDFTSRLLVIDTATASVADAVIALLVRTLPAPFPIEPLYTVTAPASFMTGLVVGDDIEQPFTVDGDATFREPGAGKGQVKYTRLSLDAEEAREHVEAGRICTRLALTWADRISFVLTDAMTLKSIKPLDVLREDRTIAIDDQGAFESDLLLFVREFGGLMDDLIGALGGQRPDEEL